MLIKRTPFLCMSNNKIGVLNKMTQLLFDVDIALTFDFHVGHIEIGQLRQNQSAMWASSGFVK